MSSIMRMSLKTTRTQLAVRMMIQTLNLGKSLIKMLKSYARMNHLKMSTSTMNLRKTPEAQTISKKKEN